MRYRYKRYGYYIPGSEFTIETYCPYCPDTDGSVTTVLGDGAIEIRCERCNYAARYDSYESLHRSSQQREHAAAISLNEHCEHRFESAWVAFQIYTRELARALGVSVRASAIRRALAKTTDDAKRAQMQADAETHAWHNYRRNCSWCEEPTPLVRYYFTQLRNHYGY